MLSSALLNAFYLLQASATTAASASEKKDESILDIIMNSSFSGQVVLTILLILSVVAVYIIVERYLTISKAGQVDHNFMNSIRMSVESGNLQAAKALCQSVDAPMARMVEKGLDRIGKPLDDINKAIENVGNLELLKLEKNLASASSINGGNCQYIRACFVERAFGKAVS